MRLNRIEVISIPVADQDRAKTFYRDVLGFVLVRDVPMSPQARWIQLTPEGAETSISLVTWFEAMRPGGVRGLVLQSDDIVAAHKSLLDKGVPISEIRSEPWGLFATFEDPDGNGWVLRQAQEVRT
jgi:catechol 2,3-dioxygenase-like lactoylglutathione lyase family enzyme